MQYEKEVDDALKEPFVQFVCQQVALSAYVIRSELNDLWKALQRLQLDQKVRFHAVLTMRRYSPLADLDSETGHMGKWTIHADSYDGTVLGFSLMSNKMGKSCGGRGVGSGVGSGVGLSCLLSFVSSVGVSKWSSLLLAKVHHCGQKVNWVSLQREEINLWKPQKVKCLRGNRNSVLLK